MTGEKEFVRSFQDLRVWQDAMSLTEHVYQLSKELPKEEIYCLTNQIRRAAISIPSNIAEGSERNGTKELIQFLYVARGSLGELQTQIMLIQRLYRLPSCAIVLELSTKLSRGLASLIKSLQKKVPNTSHPSPVTSLSPVTESLNA